MAIRFGAMESILKRSGRELVQTAASLGFEGVELCLWKSDLNHPYLTADGQRSLREASRAHKCQTPSIALGNFNSAEDALKNPVNHEKGQQFITKAIEASGALGAKVILVAFFGGGELFTEQDKQNVATALQPIAPAAEQAGVVLGIENTLGWPDNLKIIEAIGSKAVQIYFDVSNAMWWGHNAPDEIRAYAKAGVLAQVHFKDGHGGHSNAMLGEGHVNFPECVRALREIGYDGWIMLESCAPNEVLRDAKTNLEFARKCFA